MRVPSPARILYLGPPIGWSQPSSDASRTSYRAGNAARDTNPAPVAVSAHEVDSTEVAR